MTHTDQQSLFVSTKVTIRIPSQVVLEVCCEDKAYDGNPMLNELEIRPLASICGLKIPQVKTISRIKCIKISSSISKIPKHISAKLQTSTWRKMCV